MASDFAIPLGLQGLTKSVPAAKAAATGAHPDACAPEMRTCGSSSSRPTLYSSRKPLATFVSWLPDATGTTTWSGALQPSCSATSKARVLEPSA